MDRPVRVLSTLALKGAVANLAGPFEAAGGAPVRADFAPTLALLGRLRAGEEADVVILTREGLDEVVREGRVAPDSCVDLARSYVGLAVRAGEPHPAISTEAELRATLLGARAVAYSRLGASGIQPDRGLQHLAGQGGLDRDLPLGRHGIGCPRRLASPKTATTRRAL